jgi:HK97 family phage major capsid protein
MKILSPAAALEVRRLSSQISTYVEKGTALTRSDAKILDGLMAQMSAIKEAGLTDLDFVSAQVTALGAEISAEEARDRQTHERVFRSFFSKNPESNIEAELRANPNFLAGAETISYTDGPQGGVLVPATFMAGVIEGLKQTDAIFSPDVCTVIPSSTLQLRPFQIPGWDLSTIAATRIDEGVQQNSVGVPPTTQKMLNSFGYRLSLAASLEWEDDQAVFSAALDAMSRAFGVGFSRGIGADLVNGNGSDDPSGILNGLSSVYTTANNGKVVLDDITAVYFSVNRIYRASKKCAWLMNDAAYQQVRNAIDGNGRPLLNVEGDEETLMGKPVYICPSLPAYNPSLGTQKAGSFCVFGDLSYFIVRLSNMYLRRSIQTPGYIEYGLSLYPATMRADSVLFDPTSGSNPPVVAAALHE